MTAPLLGPREVFAQQLRTVRDRKRWNQQQLAERLKAMGTPLDRTAIARIENGERNVSLEEALKIAAALDISPRRLFVPDDRKQVCDLGGGYQGDAALFRGWIEGLAPLPGQDSAFFHDESDPGESFVGAPGFWLLFSSINAYVQAHAEGRSDDAAEAITVMREELDRQTAALTRLKPSQPAKGRRSGSR